MYKVIKWFWTCPSPFEQHKIQWDCYDFVKPFILYKCNSKLILVYFLTLTVLYFQTLIQKFTKVLCLKYLSKLCLLTAIFFMLLSHDKVILYPVIYCLVVTVYSYIKLVPLAYTTTTDFQSLSVEHCRLFKRMFWYVQCCYLISLLLGNYAADDSADKQYMVFFLRTWTYMCISYNACSTC